MNMKLSIGITKNERFHRIFNRKYIYNNRPNISTSGDYITDNASGVVN